MSFPPEHDPPQSSETEPRRERDLYVRVQAEFLEMPGLTLTVRQAARLFNLDTAHCEHVLRTLVRAGHLTTDGTSFASPRGGRRST